MCTNVAIVFLYTTAIFYELRSVLLIYYRISFYPSYKVLRQARLVSLGRKQ